MNTTTWFFFVVLFVFQCFGDSGDSCDNPIPLIPGVMQTHTTSSSGGVVADIGSCFKNYPSPGIFFSYTATISGEIDIEACGPNTNFDSDLLIWEGSGCVATSSCTYDDAGCSGDSPWYSGIYDYPVTQRN